MILFFVCFGVLLLQRATERVPSPAAPLLDVAGAQFAGSVSGTTGGTLPFAFPTPLRHCLLVTFPRVLARDCDGAVQHKLCSSRHELILYCCNVPAWRLPCNVCAAGAGGSERATAVDVVSTPRLRDR